MNKTNSFWTSVQRSLCRINIFHRRSFLDERTNALSNTHTKVKLQSNVDSFLFTFATKLKVFSWLVSDFGKRGRSILESLNSCLFSLYHFLRELALQRSAIETHLFLLLLFLLIFKILPCSTYYYYSCQSCQFCKMKLM